METSKLFSFLLEKGYQSGANKNEVRIVVVFVVCNKDGKCHKRG